jgi:hypothetical protein
MNDDGPETDVSVVAIPMSGVVLKKGTNHIVYQDMEVEAEESCSGFMKLSLALLV